MKHKNYKLEVYRLDVDEFDHHATMVVQDASKEFKSFATVIMNEHNIQTPTSVKEALNLYIVLLQEIERFS